MEIYCIICLYSKRRKIARELSKLIELEKGEQVKFKPRRKKSNQMLVDCRTGK